MGSVADELRKVGAGLGLVCFGLGATIAFGLASAAVFITLGEPSIDLGVVAFGLNRDHPTAMAAVTALGVLGRVLGIAGQAYCLNAPTGSRARPLAFLAMGSGVVGLTMTVVARLSESPEAAAEANLIGLIFTVGGFVFFVRFLGRLAEFLRSVRLILSVRRIQILTSGLMGLALLGMLCLSVGAAGPAILIAGVATVGSLGLFALYPLLVLDIRRVTEAAAVYAATREGEA